MYKLFVIRAAACSSLSVMTFKYILQKCISHCRLILSRRFTVNHLSFISFSHGTVWHAAMFANAKRQKSIKHSLRNRGDVIRIIQTFSHARVSAPDVDDCLLCGYRAHVVFFVLSLAVTGQSERRRSWGEEAVTSQMRWRRLVPD